MANMHLKICHIGEYEEKNFIRCSELFNRITCPVSYLKQKL